MLQQVADRARQRPRIAGGVVARRVAADLAAGGDVGRDGRRTHRQRLGQRQAERLAPGREDQHARLLDQLGHLWIGHVASEADAVGNAQSLGERRAAARPARLFGRAGQHQPHAGHALAQVRQRGDQDVELLVDAVLGHAQDDVA